MTTVAKSTPVGSLGLGPGDHVVRLHIGGGSVSFEIENSTRSASQKPSAKRQPTGFLKKWSGTVRKIEDPADDWLTHINEKHLR